MITDDCWYPGSLKYMVHGELEFSSSRPILSCILPFNCLEELSESHDAALALMEAFSLGLHSASLAV